MSNEQKTILVYSVELQKETEHTLKIDSNGEIVLTCLETGRFLKFPKGTTADELKEKIAAHKTANEGQISMAVLEAEEKALLDAFTVPNE